MSEEKTIEELKAELEKLQKENLQRDIEAEQAKVLAAKKAKEDADMLSLKDEIRKEILSEMNVTSNIDDNTGTENLDVNESRMEKFASQVKKVVGATGKSYKELCQDAYTNSMYR